VKVLVTGASGLVGCHATRALVEAGHAVKLLARSRERVRRALAPLGVRELECELGDVTDRLAVDKAIAGCDAVVHAAALYSLDPTRRDELMHTNVAGTENVLRAASRAELDPIVHVSSISALFPPAGPVLRVDGPVGWPGDAYARSKADAERIARDFQAARAPVVTVYPGAVWGPHDPTLGDGVATVLGFVKWGVIPVTPGGMPVIDARDLARALVALMLPGQGPRRFLASGHFQNNRELARVFASVTGRRFLTPRIPGAAMRALGRLGDVIARLGFEVALTSEAMQTLTQMVPGDCRALHKELGVSFRPLQETLHDVLVWMYAEGLIGARAAGRLSGENP
jgi:nucleoside-diphosphate-sugar epimerase